MRASTVWVPFAVGLLSACLSTRLVNLDQVDARWPPVAQRSWRSDVAELLSHYDAMRVLAPEDERLDPLFGGLTTLSYFGADALPRVLDQQIPSDGAALGRTLHDSCGADIQANELRLRAEGFATAAVPVFTPVWMPLAISGGAAPAAVSCDARGHASSPDAFCAFARLAMQPESGRALIVVVHGMFDSGAQLYVQRLAATLYGLGHSVLLPDMRDHGDTWRAAPQLATTLGTLEGADLLAMVARTRQSCGAHIGRVGVAAVSGGSLDAIRALTLDREHSLDAGVLALSPLLDVNQTLKDLSSSGDCALTRSIELSWQDDLALGLAAGLAAVGGAALVQALHGDAIDGHTALAGGIAAGTGLLGALTLDAFFDGGSEACVSQHAIADIVTGALRVRWRTLQRIPGTLSPAGQRLAPEDVTLADYMRERAQFQALQHGQTLRLLDPRTLARELRAALAADSSKRTRLLVLGAEDDPMLRVPALRELAERTRDMPQIYTHVLQHGGHAAMLLVQPAITRAVLQRFFAPDGRAGF
jgi:pimeloyl-ACP methyl ester carboxylesterase